jgi:Cellulase (glycosyl hydrolase family 5)
VSAINRPVPIKRREVTLPSKHAWAFCLPFTFALLLGLTGCGSGTSSTSPPPPPPAIRVSVSPGAAYVASGTEAQFSAAVANSTDQTVEWRVNNVAGGNAAVGTIVPSGLYTAPAMLFDPASVTVAAVSHADPTKSGTATVSILAAHRIAVRVAGGLGEFFDRRTGNVFTPRGNNYIRLATQERFLGGSTYYHSNFNVGLYDTPRTEAALQTMESDGYNVIRVFLNGCCTGSLGDPAGGLSSGYLANLTNFLERASAHHIFAILTTDWTPDVAPYSNSVGQQCCTLFNDINLHFLTEGGVQGNSQFFGDLVQGLTAHGARLDAILAYELRNELYFASDQPPLSLASGTVTTANGKTYDMSDPAAKQRMMNENLTWWTDRMRETILGLDPSALVTVGFFWPQQPNPSRIGDPRVIQPYPGIANSTADFVDLHTYPGLELTMSQYVENFGMSAYLEKPVMMGEFGAFRSVYFDESTTAQAMKNWQVDSCSYGFRGWLLWSWDSDEQPELWNGLSGAGSINASLAPANRPDPCVE